MEEHFRKLERLYINAPINGLYQPQIVVSEKKTEIVIDLKKEYFHAAMALHGAIYFKMLDDAAVFSANSIVKDFLLATTIFNVHFLRPVNSGKVKAIGMLISNSISLYTAESKLYNDQGKLIALGTGSFMKSKVPLSGSIGYK